MYIKTVVQDSTGTANNETVSPMPGGKTHHFQMASEALKRRCTSHGKRQAIPQHRTSLAECTVTPTPSAWDSQQPAVYTHQGAGWSIQRQSIRQIIGRQST